MSSILLNPPQRRPAKGGAAADIQLNFD